MLPGPPELEERYRRFLDGRGDGIDPLLFFLRGDRRARAGTGAWAALILSRIFFLKGDFDLSSSYLRISTVLSARDCDGALRLGLLVNKALILKARGRRAEAERLLRGIVDRAIRSSEPFVAAKAASNLALCMARFGDAREAVSYACLAERLYRALGCRIGLVRLSMTRSLLEARQGRIDEAIEGTVTALRQCADEGLDRETAIGRSILAELFLSRGELGQARSVLDVMASMDETLRRFKAVRYRYYCLERDFHEKAGRIEESGRFEVLGEALRDRLGIAARSRGAIDYRNEASEPPAVVCLAVAGAESTASTEAFVTGDPAVVSLVAEVRRASSLSLPILLQGESGTGKDLMARLIHAWSGRGSEPFVPVNVAALPVDLFESMAFGHAKGAFTGASCRRPGLIESAGRGTIFLDEIAELAPTAQAKLLRLVDRGEFIPLGEGKHRTNRARIVAATNRDLKTDCASGRFRADLYYRLAALTFTIPPLRERRGDIALLAEHFLEKMCTLHGLARMKLGSDAVEILSSHDWPGNARELESEIMKAALKTGRGTIRVRHLSSGLLMGGARPPQSAGEGLRAKMNAAAKTEIVEALCRCGGNRSRAAATLGLKRTTLISSMKRLGIEW